MSKTISDINDAMLNRQADRIKELEQERDQLRDLLRPFAALLQEHNRKGSDDQPIFQINDAAITLGNLRRALAATEPK